MPKPSHPQAKKNPAEIWMSPDQAAAEAPSRSFPENTASNIPKPAPVPKKTAMPCRPSMTFPRGIGCICAPPTPSKACFRPSGTGPGAARARCRKKTARVMLFKPVTPAARTWRKLKGENLLPGIVQGVRFANGNAVEQRRIISTGRLPLCRGGYGLADDRVQRHV